MKKRMLLVSTATCIVILANAQLLTWSPAFPKETDNIVITVDATKGNQGLLNYSGNVYVHLGAITNLSTGPSNWLHVPFTWGSTEAAAQATPDGPNKWKFTISNPRSFFNLAVNEQLKYIAILFRQGNCTNCAAQRNADGADMYVPIYNSDLAVRIDVPPSQPTFNPEPEIQNWMAGTVFTVKAVANRTGNMKLLHNGVEIASAVSVDNISGSSTVTAIGNQQIVAAITEASVTIYDTINIFVSPASSPVAALPNGVRDGINYEPGDTSVTLVLRAPGKSKASVIGEFNNWTQTVSHVMNKTPDGKFFWLRLHPLTPGTEYAYQYIVDDTIRIADPYAEKILDPNNDQYITASTYPGLKPYPAGQTGIVSVLQTAKPAYNWAVNSFNRPDKRGLVVYELLLRDFVAAHNWKTLMDSLNYLKTLGINAIELMPFNEFEGNLSWGYNPSFYFAADKYYGPENTLKRFIDSCHSKGIAVIMDIALNHSFGQSPMVQLYWDDVNNRPSASSPWYNPVPKHAFNVGYDMNHSTEHTKYFTSRVMEHWLKEYKIDGFRFDLSKGFTQTQTCDNNGGNCDVGAWGNYDASRVALWKAYYDTTQLKSPGSYAILEHFAANQEEIELSNYGLLLWGHLNHQYSQAAMGHPVEWDFSNVLHSARNWTKPHLVSYMESHDEERIVYRNINFGNSFGSYNIRDTATALKRMELAASFFFTIPGPKMIWQFGELGYDYSINYCTNGTINNDCRLDNKPIRWDYLNDPRRKSVYNVYSRLINLRHHPWYKEVFLSGSVDKNLGGAIKTMRIYSGDSSQIVVVGNFGTNAQSATVTFPVSGTWFDYLQNSTFTATGNLQSVSLLPGEYRVFINRNVNNITVTPVNNIPWNGSSLQAKAFPNPVGANQYQVEIDLPQAGKLTIELYNITGQFIETIQDGFMNRGKHRITIQNNGSRGNYYLKLKTKTATKTIPVTIQ